MWGPFRKIRRSARPRIYNERDDFMEEPPKGYKRLEPAGEVRLRGSYVIRADEAIKDADGNIVDVLVTVGDVVKAGQSVLITEAMKMETEVQAAIAATTVLPEPTSPWIRRSMGSGWLRS